MDAEISKSRVNESVSQILQDLMPKSTIYFDKMDCKRLFYLC